MMKKPKVVITNRCFPETQALLSQHADLIINDTAEPLSYAQALERCHDADALMVFMPDKIDAAFLSACPKLRVIGAALKGYDNIDVAAATKAGVWVTIVPDLLTVPTAELAIGLMLALGRRILQGDAGIRANGFQGWRPTLYGRGLSGETIGIVGFGCVGQAIAERLGSFGCELLAYDAAPQSLPSQLGSRVRMTALEEIIERATYVVLALPLLPSTQGLFDEGMINRMRPGAYLINPARGSLVDEGAIAHAIAAGRLAGYAADVFECEDWARPDRPDQINATLVADRLNTVFTPHLGSAVEVVRREIELSAATSILEALSGKAPCFVINDIKRPIY